MPTPSPPRATTPIRSRYGREDGVTAQFVFDDEAQALEFLRGSH
jgi:hypothetical protein